MLKLWGRRNSINVQKVLWTLGELSIPYEHDTLGGKSDGVEKPELVKLNPNRRVPIIDDEGAVVWESNAIVRYLAAKYGKGTLWPEEDVRRAQSDMWMDWALSDLQPAFVTLFVKLWRTPEIRRDWTAIQKGVVRTNTLLRMLGRHLSDGRKFVAGDSLTVGDISTGVLMYRYYNIEIRRPSMPNLEAWYARLRESEAYRSHVMTPFEELKGSRAG